MAMQRVTLRQLCWHWRRCCPSPRPPTQTHLLPQPQRHAQALQLDLEAQRGGVLVGRPAAPPLEAQRRQRRRRLCSAAESRLGGLQLLQLRPCLARLC